MRWPSAWLAASSAALLLAGCGSHNATAPKPPRIPSALAGRLAREADAVAAAPGCSAHDAAVRLQQDVIGQISRIPTRYREQLMSAANELVSRTPPCPAPEPHREHGHGKHKHKKHDEQE